MFTRQSLNRDNPKELPIKSHTTTAYPLRVLRGGPGLPPECQFYIRLAG